jgi:hypothetical protein
MSCNAAYARCTFVAAGDLIEPTFRDFREMLQIEIAVGDQIAFVHRPLDHLDALVVEPAGGVDLAVSDVFQLLADQLLGAQNIAAQNKTPAAACRGNRGLAIDWIAFS